jgi:hypothetical protein
MGDVLMSKINPAVASVQKVFWNRNTLLLKQPNLFKIRDICFQGHGQELQVRRSAAVYGMIEQDAESCKHRSVRILEIFFPGSRCMQCCT